MLRAKSQCRRNESLSLLYRLLSLYCPSLGIRICIIGGGIGGLTTAMHQTVWFLTDIYEQRHARRWCCHRYRPNAMRVLQHSLADKILEKAGEIREIQWLDQNGRPINRISITETSSDAVPAIALHRADLQSVLLGALPHSSLHLGNSLLEYIADNEAVVAHFANGNSCESDFLIEADASIQEFALN